jgi:two-component system chemotaxis sensor kinase CheA
MAQDPYRYFRLEARELVEQFAAGILELEKNGGSPELIQRLLRLAHTLKGAARVVKQPQIADRAHALEDTLSPFREIAAGIPADIVGTLLKHLDDINGCVLALTPGEPAPASMKSTPAPDEGFRTVRADVAEMDALLEGISEAHALLNGLRMAGGLAIEAQHMANLLMEQLAPRGTGPGGRQGPTDPESAYRTTEELRRRVGKLERGLGASTEQMDRELGQLRDAAEQLRLAPAGVLFTALERTARDTAQALAKQVIFEGKGSDIRLDAYVLTTIQRALVQVVRNAVAHGIESETERRAAGKPPVGRVSIDVMRRGRRIVFQCSDDGRGVDLDAVRRIAAQRGLLGPEAGRENAEALIDLLLRGGISTSDAVTEVAGRGVGLDVVRAAVAQLGGEVAIRTERGIGTTFDLVVPLSVASLEVLVVEAAGNTVAIPLDAVRTAIRIAAAEISWSLTGASIVFGQDAIPFVPLPSLLYGVRQNPDRTWSAIIVSGADGTAAFGVDRLLGTARAVVRPLPKYTPSGVAVAGASLDSEGNPRLVLDPDGMVSEARRADVSAVEPVPARRPVLVIDDSLTTRMLEQSILESAGYEVDVAASAEEGLESARRRRYALFLVDVEMPGMDGFTFVERIRMDPDLHDIPAILVTSRAAPEDRQRGSDVGARGYIVKSEFDQTHLLTLIRPLVA